MSISATENLTAAKPPVEINAVRELQKVRIRAVIRASTCHQPPPRPPVRMS